MFPEIRGQRWFFIFVTVKKVFSFPQKITALMYLNVKQQQKKGIRNFNVTLFSVLTDTPFILCLLNLSCIKALVPSQCKYFRAG